MRRTREIGIRVAMGSAPRHVLVLKDAMVAVSAGVAAGLLLAYNQWHLLRRLSSAVERFDPVLYTAAAGTLVVAALAAWLPARAALRVDPVVALRSE